MSTFANLGPGLREEAGALGYEFVRPPEAGAPYSLVSKRPTGMGLLFFTDAQLDEWLAKEWAWIEAEAEARLEENREYFLSTFHD